MTRREMRSHRVGLTNLCKNLLCEITRVERCSNENVGLKERGERLRANSGSGLTSTISFWKTLKYRDETQSVKDSLQFIPLRTFLVIGNHQLMTCFLQPICYAKLQDRVR
jgi:hypothetical protein